MAISGRINLAVKSYGYGFSIFKKPILFCLSVDSAQVASAMLALVSKLVADRPFTVVLKHGVSVIAKIASFTPRADTKAGLMLANFAVAIPAARASLAAVNVAKLWTYLGCHRVILPQG